MAIFRSLQVQDTKSQNAASDSKLACYLEVVVMAPLKLGLPINKLEVKATVLACFLN